MRAILMSILLLAACGDDGNTVKKDAGVSDGHAVDSGGGPDASCFTNPQTYTEIINACTTATKIYKDSHPPLLEDRTARCRRCHEGDHAHHRARRHDRCRHRV